MQEADANVNLEELIKIQKQQMQALGRSGMPPSRGGPRPPSVVASLVRGRPEPGKPFITGERLKGSPSFVAQMMKQQAEGGKNQSIFQYSQTVNVMPQTIGLVKLEALFDEMVN